MGYLVKCIRCRNVHNEDDRVRVLSKDFDDIPAWDLACPKCNARVFQLIPQKKTKTEQLPTE